MKKTVKLVNGNTLDLETNAALVVKFRKAFGKDFLPALGKTMSEGGDERIEIAYICSGAYDRGIPFDDWVTEFAIADIITMSAEVVDLLVDELNMTVPQ